MQTQALTDSGLLKEIINQVSAQTNISIPETALTTLVNNNIPRITDYLTDKQQTLDLDLSLSDADFATIFGTLPSCQPQQQPLQDGKLICKPNVPISVLLQATQTAVSSTTHQATTDITTGFTEAKQTITLITRITWIVFFLALLLIVTLLILNHTSWSSALAWTTVALALPGFLILGIALLALPYLTPYLPTNSSALVSYLTLLLTALLSTLKTYSLIILGIALLALFGSFITRKVK